MLNMEKTQTHHWLWTVIDLNAIASNVRKLRSIINPGARLMTVVKADGYGHGAVKVARTALENGADHLGVARIDEGIELRKAGISAPVLIFGHTAQERANDLIDHDLTPTVYTLDSARAFCRTAGFRGKPLGVHIKVDTGMGRLGLMREASHTTDMIMEIAKLSHIDIQGIFTHFASADSRDKTFAREQFKRFTDILAQLKTRGINPGICHAANSAAVIDMPETHLDMVRTGIATYGLYPSGEVDKGKINLTPALTLKTRIIHLKQFPEGHCLGYGGTWKSIRPSRIATLPIGYADGLKRMLSSKGYMLVKGRKAPIVGRICMDMTMLDVTEIPDISAGDEAIIIGSQANNEIHADALANEIDSINYEIVTTIGQRVTRVYAR